MLVVVPGAAGRVHLPHAATLGMGCGTLQGRCTASRAATSAGFDRPNNPPGTGACDSPRAALPPQLPRGSPGQAGTLWGWGGSGCRPRRVPRKLSPVIRGDPVAAGTGLAAQGRGAGACRGSRGWCVGGLLLTLCPTAAPQPSPSMSCCLSLSGAGEAPSACSCPHPWGCVVVSPHIPLPWGRSVASHWRSPAAGARPGCPRAQREPWHRGGAARGAVPGLGTVALFG